MGQVKGHCQGWWTCVIWQTPGVVVYDFWSPQWQGLTFQLSQVDLSLALWGRDSSIVSAWTRPFLLTAVAAWHEMVLSLF